MANTTTIDKFFDVNSYLTPIQHQILETLKKEGPMHRAQLVKTLDTPRTTIYDNLLKLQKRKTIEKFTRNNGLRGRSLVYWKLNEN